MNELKLIIAMEICSGQILNLKVMAISIGIGIYCLERIFGYIKLDNLP